MMTQRPRTAGLDALRRQSIRAYHEPFTPILEERDEDEAHILQLQLPDFNAQQIRFLVEVATRAVAVTGDRYMGNNRWLRVDKTYPVPDNCIISKIAHKFHDGILTITMPKQPTPPETAAKTAAETEATAAALPKEAEQPLPETGREESVARPDPKPEPKEPEETSLRDDSNASPAEKTADEDNRKSAEASEMAKEEAPPEAAAAPETENGKEAEPSMTRNQTRDQKIGSDDQKISGDDQKIGSDERKIGGSDRKPSEREETKEEVREKGKEKEEITKGKESETSEKVDSAEEKSKTGAGTRTARVIGALKPTIGFAIGRLPLPVKVNLAATAVIVAAYFAYTYFQLPAN